MCFDVCPEPWGLQPASFEPTFAPDASPVAIAEERVTLPASGPLVINGMYASMALVEQRSCS